MTTIVQLSRIEAAHLVDLVTQFVDLLDDDVDADPGVQRLSPDAYPGDDEGSREYRRLTQSDALARRREWATRVLETLSGDGVALTSEGVAADPTAPYPVVLDAEAADAWLRTLSGLRLVLATRLGIEADGAHDGDDPRFGVYDWLGFRLDELVRALSE